MINLAGASVPVVPKLKKQKQPCTNETLALANDKTLTFNCHITT